MKTLDCLRKVRVNESSVLAWNGTYFSRASMKEIRNSSSLWNFLFTSSIHPCMHFLRKFLSILPFKVPFGIASKESLVASDANVTHTVHRLLLILPCRTGSFLLLSDWLRIYRRHWIHICFIRITKTVFACIGHSCYSDSCIGDFISFLLCVYWTAQLHTCRS